MQIIRGKIESALKVIIYGPEGIGKSTFASQFPNPVFIDTEGSTKFMDVARTPAPSSWAMLIEQVQYFKNHPQECKTLVIDTADWAETLCINSICAKKQMTSIEDIGYGKGYVFLEEEFGRLLNLLEDVVGTGINVVLNCHAQMRKFEQPDELGAYDRWELKLQKKTAALVKEWADIILFANYKTYVVNVDNQGAQKGKNKAQGGKRVMHTTHHPCWDAKNRHGLADELPFEFVQIAHLFSSQTESQSVAKSAPDPIMKDPNPPVQKEQPTETPKQDTNQEAAESVPNEKSKTETPQEQASPKEESRFYEINGQPTCPEIWEGIPRGLCELMREANILPSEIQQAVGKRGYFPSDMPIHDYPIDFINGVLIGAWPQIRKFIEDDPDRLPF